MSPLQLPQSTALAAIVGDGARTACWRRSSVVLGLAGRRALAAGADTAAGVAARAVGAVLVSGSGRCRVTDHTPFLRGWSGVDKGLLVSQRADVTLQALFRYSTACRAGHGFPGLPAVAVRGRGHVLALCAAGRRTRGVGDRVRHHVVKKTGSSTGSSVGSGVRVLGRALWRLGSREWCVSFLSGWPVALVFFLPPSPRARPVVFWRRHPSWRRWPAGAGGHPG